MTYLEWLENPSSKYLKGPGYIILIYLTLPENNKKISRSSDLFKSTSYFKGEPFLEWNLYKRVTFSVKNCV